MKLIDILLIIPLIWFTLKGFRRGLVIELATLIALIGGIYIAYFFSHITASFILKTFNISSAYLQPVSFIITFVVVVILVFMLAKAMETIVKTVCLSFFNKLAGGVFGFLKVAVILGFILFHISYLDSEKKILSKDNRENSFTYTPLVTLATTAIPLMKDLRDKVLDNLQLKAAEKEAEAVEV